MSRSIIPITNFFVQAKAAEDIIAQHLKGMVAQGYRRVSWGHGIVARIDRPDWVQVLAEHLGRSPAEFYKPGAKDPDGIWADVYRRSLSNDTVTIDPPHLVRLVPSSCHDPIGYVDLKEVKS